MTTSDFRITSCLPKTHDIALPRGGTEISVPDSEKPVEVNLPPSVASEDKKWLIVVCEGLPSKTHAEAIGRRVKKALSLCGVSLQLGSDVGKDIPPSSYASVGVPGRGESNMGVYNPVG